MDEGGAAWRACNAIDLADWTNLVSEVRPVLAASSVFCACPIESSSALRSLARVLSACEVKKLVGLSRAELTFLPVASRPCVVAINAAVLCRDSRFCRTPADRVMLEAIGEPFWSKAVLAGYSSITWIEGSSSHRGRNVP